MHLYEKATPVFGEDELTLHLSEPHFTLWQRLWRRVRQSGAYLCELL